MLERKTGRIWNEATTITHFYPSFHQLCKSSPFHIVMHIIWYSRKSYLNLWLVMLMNLLDSTSSSLVLSWKKKRMISDVITTKGIPIRWSLMCVLKYGYHYLAYFEGLGVKKVKTKIKRDIYIIVFQFRDYLENSKVIVTKFRLIRTKFWYLLISEEFL